MALNWFIWMNQAGRVLPINMLKTLKGLKAHLPWVEVSTRLRLSKVRLARQGNQTEKDPRMPKMNKETADRINSAAGRIQKNRSRRSNEARDRAYVWHSNAIEGEASTVSREFGVPARSR